MEGRGARLGCGHMEEGGRVRAWSVATSKSVLAGEVGEEFSADRRAQCEKRRKLNQFEF
jgi:hypothetical protein